ncbi:MAG: LacI family DNA-binding transcriptional regulator [Spirochaetaceae bacterium]|jgi:LacI family repressor for deo operon, udp, cdd, tsx, nupC, and nupG|nr:LacI family DNA-binding transcriptional regulator [Spirochaetaceae bacterium]
MGLEKMTYQNLADKTGFSPATISRVLSGADSVRGETRQALLEKIADLGYETADFAARSKKQSRGIIIFNLPTLENPFYAEIISGAKAAAVQRGYQMLINEEHINESTINGFLAMLKKTQAAGLILTNHVAPCFLRRINDAISTVQCCEYDKNFDMPFVSIDDAQAARSAMQFLFSLGCKQIAFLNGPIRYKYARERLQGYRESLDAAGIEETPAFVMNLPEISYNLAVSAVSALFRSGARPEAIFCASDVFAAAVIKAAFREHISVPGDLMVVGFDNVPISWMTSPSITTINQPCERLGVSACELLAERIACGKNTVPASQGIFYETEIIVRESTAK